VCGSGIVNGGDCHGGCDSVDVVAYPLVEEDGLGAFGLLLVTAGHHQLAFESHAPDRLKGQDMHFSVCPSMCVLWCVSCGVCLVVCVLWCVSDLVQGTGARHQDVGILDADT
jgi:hypothetical protein